MADYEALKLKVNELAERDWDMPAIEARYRKLAAEGIPRKVLDKDEIWANRQQILDRVQRLAEEYNMIAHNCARGTALALMEEFGLGSMEITKVLSPFPGFALTGWMCGGVTGGLIGLGLYFGSEDVLDYDTYGVTLIAAREFMSRFEEQLGDLVCSKLQEKVIFGRYMDPLASPENKEAYIEAKGLEKCSILPGIGARLAAEIIIESMKP